MITETLQAARIEHRDYVAAVEEYYRRGWTDGLPVIPPEPARVAAFLDAGGVTAREVIGAVPTRDIIVTAEDVAINAVMAGCLPGVRAGRANRGARPAQRGSDPALGDGDAGQRRAADHRQRPGAEQIGVECGQGCMGPGFRANATIGRALRLVVRNVLRSIPHELDRGVFSTPNRYSFCFGEDEEGTSWRPAARRTRAAGRSERGHRGLHDGPDHRPPAQPRPRADHRATWRGCSSSTARCGSTSWGASPTCRSCSARSTSASSPRRGGPRPTSGGRCGTRSARSPGSPTGRPSGSAGPEGILLVAAGGPGDQVHRRHAAACRPGGNARRCQPGHGRRGQRATREVFHAHHPRPHRRPQSRPGTASRGGEAAAGGARVGLVSNGLGRTEDLLGAVYPLLRETRVSATRSWSASPSGPCRRCPRTGTGC